MTEETALKLIAAIEALTRAISASHAPTYTLNSASAGVWCNRRPRVYSSAPGGGGGMVDAAP